MKHLLLLPLPPHLIPMACQFVECSSVFVSSKRASHHDAWLSLQLSGLLKAMDTLASFQLKSAMHQLIQQVSHSLPITSYFHEVLLVCDCCWVSVLILTGSIGKPDSPASHQSEIR